MTTKLNSLTFKHLKLHTKRAENNNNKEKKGGWGLKKVRTGIKNQTSLFKGLLSALIWTSRRGERDLDQRQSHWQSGYELPSGSRGATSRKSACFFKGFPRTLAEGTALHLRFHHVILLLNQMSVCISTAPSPSKGKEKNVLVRTWRNAMYCNQISTNRQQRQLHTSDISHNHNQHSLWALLTNHIYIYTTSPKFWKKKKKKMIFFFKCFWTKSYSHKGYI